MLQRKHGRDLSNNSNQKTSHRINGRGLYNHFANGDLMFPILWAGFGTLMVRLPGGPRASSLAPLHMNQIVCLY
jgi:hypothetical protein